MAKEANLRLIDPVRDADALAEMWNESDLEWPGTWNGGVPTNARDIRDWHEREEYIAVFVWDEGEKIGGYCSLVYDKDDGEALYLALLNVSPRFQGRSIGRRMLVRSVEKTIEDKKAHVDLDTWSGNVKAMAPYKRTGFFWDAGPYPVMRNYMPAILSMPCTRYFFDRHDWYESLQRSVEQVPDEEEWEGLRVFTYRFSAPAERYAPSDEAASAEAREELTVRVDREARHVTAVETAELYAAATVDDIEPVRGGKTVLRWKLQNRRDTPVVLSLTAKESGDLSVDFHHRATLGPGETITLEAPVSVSAKAEAVDRDKTAPRVRSDIRWDDLPIELATGIRPRVEMVVSIDPEEITLAPGNSQPVRVILRSQLPDDVEARVRLTVSDGLSVDESAQTNAVPARGYGGFETVLAADGPGVFEVTFSGRVEWKGGTVDLADAKHAVFALEPGGLLFHQDGAVRFENEIFRATLEAGGGQLKIRDRTTGRYLGTEGARPIPPKWPSEYSESDFKLKAERDGHGVVLSATYAPKKTPGLVFSRIIRLNAGPVISVEHVVENTGFDPRTFRLYQFVTNGGSEFTTLTLPLGDGVLRAQCADRPAPDDYAFKRGDSFAETWGAFEMSHGTIGVLWPGDLDEIEWNGYEFQSVSRETTCAPQSRISIGLLRLFVGDGGWQGVRRVWRRTNGHQVNQFDPLPPVLGEFEVSTDPPTAVVIGEETEIRFRVAQWKTRKASGTVTFAMPDGWRCDPMWISFSEIDWKTPFTGSVRLATSQPPGVYNGRMVLEGGERNVEADVPLIRLGDGSAVEVEEGESARHRIFTIRNRRLEIDVVPSFLGSVSAIRDAGDECNHLASAFPNPRVFGASYPWYGGLQPRVEMGRLSWTAPLEGETFTAETVFCKDARGIEWTGVRQRAVLSLEETRGLTLELDTLTLGASPVIKLVWRLVNGGGTPRQLNGGWNLFLQPDGEMHDTVLFSADYERKRIDWHFRHHGGHWTAAANPRTGRTLVLVSPLKVARMDSWGIGGGHFRLKTKFEVPAHGAKEMPAYLVLADSREEARRYAVLKDLQ
ncbi:MAG: GNAT family N-acetyltransferase [Gemmatimonadetes bacterium]|nr:GNAT family N-acetyltransferase [Gemmatimonadota bacterium]